jgi:hypothetical protein
MQHVYLDQFIIQNMCARDLSLRTMCQKAIDEWYRFLFNYKICNQSHFELLLRFSSISYEVLRFVHIDYPHLLSYARLMADEALRTRCSQTHHKVDQAAPPDRFYLVDWRSASKLVSNKSVYIHKGKAYITYIDAADWVSSRWKYAVQAQQARHVREVFPSHIQNFMESEGKASVWKNRPLRVKFRDRDRYNTALQSWQSFYWRGSIISPESPKARSAMYLPFFRQPKVESSSAAKRTLEDAKKKQYYLFRGAVNHWQTSSDFGKGERGSWAVFSSSLSTDDNQRRKLQQLETVMQYRLKNIDLHCFSEENYLHHLEFDIPFTNVLWQFLPPCIQVAVGTAIDAGRHLFDAERMFVFQFLAHVGVPLEHAEQLWYEICKRSKKLSYPIQQKEWRSFSKNNTSHGQYPRNLYATRAKIDRQKSSDTRGFQSCATVIKKNSSWCPFAEEKNGDIEQAVMLCSQTCWSQTKRICNAIISREQRLSASSSTPASSSSSSSYTHNNTKQRRHIQIKFDENIIETWPNTTYWSPAVSFHKKISQENFVITKHTHSEKVNTK